MSRKTQLFDQMRQKVLDTWPNIDRNVAEQIANLLVVAYWMGRSEQVEMDARTVRDAPLSARHAFLPGRDPAPALLHDAAEYILKRFLKEVP